MRACEEPGCECDEELYINGHTVVWIKGGPNGVGKVIKTFTMDAMVLEVFSGVQSIKAVTAHFLSPAHKVGWGILSPPYLAVWPSVRVSFPDNILETNSRIVFILHTHRGSRFAFRGLSPST